MIPMPWVSYWGRPARPNICMTSRGLSSCQLPLAGLYTWVPLMMTVWAGRFTPHASVAVDTKTCSIAEALARQWQAINGCRSAVPAEHHVVIAQCQQTLPSQDRGRHAWRVWWFAPFRCLRCVKASCGVCMTEQQTLQHGTAASSNISNAKHHNLVSQVHFTSRTA